MEVDSNLAFRRISSPLPRTPSNSMVSPLGDRTDPPSPPMSPPMYDRVLSQFQDDVASRLNVEQMFILIGGVLPFEACLYYQVLPLFLDGSRLSLGMVNPQDAPAIDYVRRIVAYHHYSLVPRQISSDALQATLSAYLNYAGKQAPPPPGGFPTMPRVSGRARAEQSIDPNMQKTLVVDSPEELSPPAVKLPPDSPAPPPQMPFKPGSPERPPRGFQFVEEAPSPSPQEHRHNPQAAASKDAPVPTVPPLLHPIPTLDLPAQYLTSPIEVLANLPPKEMLQELLARVLHGGIGRLYFERQPQAGRILWSQNGVLQSVIHRLELDVFQSIIHELKLMTNLPLIPVQTSKQVEVERLYRQNRLLLRFKFMANGGGEEATLQVLRGAALKFYQQQQLARLERDALSIAKQLQIKVNEIRDRATMEPSIMRDKLEVLPALSSLLKHIEQQLNGLGIDINQSSDS